MIPAPSKLDRNDMPLQVDQEPRGVPYHVG
jgi:hypothetical protein